ncbi:MAG TPA: hypothetical protein DHU96_04275 [Actinobacteria bacterium]|nr:hypothetical protein [Actinomycetota bacterium]
MPQAGPAVARVPLPPADPALQHRSVAALFVAMLSLAGLLGFNFNLHRAILIVVYALLAGAMALWLSLSAITRARRNRTARPRGSVAATVIAGVGIGLSAAMLLAFAVFGKQLTAYGQCLSGAGTISAQQSCYSQFSHTLSHQISGLGSGSHR